MDRIPSVIGPEIYGGLSRRARREVVAQKAPAGFNQRLPSVGTATHRRRAMRTGPLAPKKEPRAPGFPSPGHSNSGRKVSSALPVRCAGGNNQWPFKPSQPSRWRGAFIGVPQGPAANRTVTLRRRSNVIDSNVADSNVADSARVDAARVHSACVDSACVDRAPIGAPFIGAGSARTEEPKIDAARLQRCPGCGCRRVGSRARRHRRMAREGQPTLRLPASLGASFVSVIHLRTPPASSPLAAFGGRSIR